MLLTTNADSKRKPRVRDIYDMLSGLTYMYCTVQYNTVRVWQNGTSGSYEYILDCIAMLTGILPFILSYHSFLVQLWNQGCC